MSSKEIAISARGLGKSYVIRHRQAESTAAETVIKYLANPLQRSAKEVVWSLRDMSFDIARGDVVAVIGRNGAGKSTLLKILSRITTPTTGEAKIKGRVGSLIEVGTGFQPELTGRENIYLNGAILGMGRSEITRRFDEIVNFSGVEAYLDTPVKRYSSGMYIRLAFAVAAHLDTDVLFVDEVLSVGDTEFQKKSLGRLSDVANEGRTVLFVGHNMAAFESFCTRGLLLDRGQLRYAGALKDTVAEYNRLIRPEHGGGLGQEAGPDDYGDRYDHFRSADLVEDGRSTRYVDIGAKVSIKVVLDATRLVDGPTLVLWIENTFGSCVLTLKSPRNQRAIRRVDGLLELTCEVDSLPLMPGEYVIGLSLWKSGSRIEGVEGGINFIVSNADTFGDGWGANDSGVCVARSHWRIRPQLAAQQLA